MKFTMIVAMDMAFNIGKDGGLPFHIRKDMVFFRNTTMGKPCIMGRKTFESLPKPLDGRLNIVVTTKPNILASQYNGTGNVCFVPNITGAMKAAMAWHDRDQGSNISEIARSPEDEQVFVIGGLEIYKLMLPFIDDAYITRVLREVDGCDVNIGSVIHKMSTHFDIETIDTFSDDAGTVEAELLYAERWTEPSKREILSVI
jgi:dihydrofolate reductase